MNKAQLEAAIKRAKLLYQNPDSIVQELSSALELKKDVTDQQRKDWLAKTYNGNQQEVAAAVTTQINKDLLGHLFALGFLQRVTLGPGDWPVLTTDVRDKNYTVTYLAEDGKAKKKQRVPRRTHVQYLMQMIGTPEVEYPLMSLQVGDINESARVQSELTYELNLKLDTLARALLDAGVMASGLRATLNLHSSIVAANIPDKNYYDLSGTDTAGKISVEKIKQLLDYFERFSSDVELDGTPLQINTIYMSSLNKRDIWDFVSLVSGYDSSGMVEDPKDTITPGMRDGIFQSGTINSIFGYPIRIVTRNTITSPYAYISTNKPAGFFWEKPSFDKTIINSSAEMEDKNLNSMKMKKTVAMVIPSEWSYRFLKVKF